MKTKKRSAVGLVAQQYGAGLTIEESWFWLVARLPSNGYYLDGWLSVDR